MIKTLFLLITKNNFLKVFCYYYKMSNIKGKYIQVKEYFATHDPNQNNSNYTNQNTISKYSNTSEPNFWGPSFWLSLHNGADKYPINASKLVKERMKGFILGIPYMLPCTKCFIHASDYIESKKDNMDEICNGRYNLFKFFYEFHNTINIRLGKKTISLEEAFNIYSN